MAQFLDVAAVTIMPNMFLGAPKGDAQKYAIGYVDTFGVKRAFVIDIDAAEEMAQGMLQEIAHVKAKNDRDTLKSDLRGIIGKIELGINLDAIRDELSDLAAEG